MNIETKVINANLISSNHPNITEEGLEFLCKLVKYIEAESPSKDVEASAILSLARNYNKDYLKNGKEALRERYKGHFVVEDIEHMNETIDYLLE